MGRKKENEKKLLTTENTKKCKLDDSNSHRKSAKTSDTPTPSCTSQNIKKEKRQSSKIPKKKIDTSSSSEYESDDDTSQHSTRTAPVTKSHQKSSDTNTKDTSTHLESKKRKRIMESSDNPLSGEHNRKKE